MVRISGVDLPVGKRIEIGLTHVYGIGRSLSRQILAKNNIDINKKVRDLTEDEVLKLRQVIDKGYVVEGELRSQVAMSIKRLIDINCYRGLRHKKGLPLRGQRTKTNARTRKGKRSSVKK